MKYISKTRYFVLVILSLVLQSTAAAQGPIDYENYMHSLGIVDIPATDIDTVGDTAYVSTMDDGFYILDITDPTKMEIVGSLKPLRYTYGVSISGNYAYLAGSNNNSDLPDSTFLVLDISDPTAPELCFSTATSFGSAEEVFVNGEAAYVATKHWLYGSKLKVYDLINPESPSLVWEVSTGSGYGKFKVSDNLLVVDCGGDKICVYDVSNPLQPTFQCEIIAPSENMEFLDANLVSGFLYANIEEVSSYGPSVAHLFIYDLSIPGSPVKVGETSGYYTTDMLHDGDYAYYYGSPLSYGGRSIVVLDVSDPTLPIQFGELGAGQVGSYPPLAITDNCLLLGGSNLQTFDISSHAFAPFFGEINIGWPGTDLIVHNDMAYVGCFNRAISSVNVSDPWALTYESSAVTTGRIWALDMEGDYIYGTDDSEGLVVASIVNPSTPQIIGVSDIAYEAETIAVANGFAYTANYNDWFAVHDVSDPTNPTYIRSKQVPEGVTGFDAVGNYFYLLAGSNLEIYNVSTPSELSLTGSLNFGYGSDIEIAGDLAYISGDYLTIVDVSNPASPELLGQLRMDCGGPQSYEPGPPRLSVYGTSVYVASGQADVQIIDVSVPQTPRMIGRLDTPGSAVAVSATRDGLYVLGTDDDFSTLYVASLHGDPLSSLDALMVSPFDNTINMYPNPFNPQITIEFLSPQIQHSEIEVFDIRGRLVRSLTVSSGASSVVWDGRDFADRDMPSGTYMVRQRGDIATTTKKISLIR